jgi:hypothetical protein
VKKKALTRKEVSTPPKKHPTKKPLIKKSLPSNTVSTSTPQEFLLAFQQDMAGLL